ncbi:uncharacterized protein ACB058_003606 isoform 1-T1 [Synchiropus picturatus]
MKSVMLPPWAEELMDALSYFLYFELACLGIVVLIFLPRCCTKKERLLEFSGNPPSYEECEVRYGIDPLPSYTEVIVPDLAVPDTNLECETNRVAELRTDVETKINVETTPLDVNDTDFGSDLSTGVDNETDKSPVSSDFDVNAMQ